MEARLRKKLILSLLLAVVMFVTSFLTLPVYSFAQTKMINGLRLDTDKDRYTMGENVTLSFVILNDSNSTLYFSVDQYTVGGVGPLGPTLGQVVNIYPGGLSSIPPRGEHLYVTIDWPVSHEWINSPGVYSIGAGLRYILPDGTRITNGAIVSVLFTLL